MDQVLHAIAEPRRREILYLVRHRELAAGDIAAHFDVTPPAISQHLKVLREAGLVSLRREGTKRYYRVNPGSLSEVRHFIEDFWGSQLQTLKAAAEDVAKREQDE